MIMRLEKDLEACILLFSDKLYNRLKVDDSEALLGKGSYTALLVFHLGEMEFHLAEFSRSSIFLFL